MIIIQIAGGLGNQMQQYALYRRFLSLGREAKIDLSWFDDRTAQQNVYAPRAFELSYFQGLPYEACTAQEKAALTGGDGLLGKLRRKLWSVLPPKTTGVVKVASERAGAAQIASEQTGTAKINSKQAGAAKMASERQGEAGSQPPLRMAGGRLFQETEIYHPQLLTLTDAYVCGYFACEKYYAEILPQLRELFVFPESGDSQVQAQNEAMLRQLREEQTVPVSVHIRRGDYLAAENAALLGGICTDAYYQGAVEAVRRKAEKSRILSGNCVQGQTEKQNNHLAEQQGDAERTVRLHFYIFSDDPDYARTLHFGLPQEENTVIDWNSGRDSLLDMQLMAHCRHNICANSTFSFWGARLNPYPDKIQVRPSVHKNTQTYDPQTMHAYWAGWTLVDREGWEV